MSIFLDLLIEFIYYVSRKNEFEFKTKKQLWCVKQSTQILNTLYLNLVSTHGLMVIFNTSTLQRQIVTSSAVSSTLNRN